MKKRILCLTLALVTVFALCMPANAAALETVSPRYNSTSGVIPELYISGSNAVCKLNVVADRTDASIRATVRLQDPDGTYLASWNITGTGTLSWIQTHAISRGTYTMTFYIQVYHPSTGSDYISDSLSVTKR